MSELKGGASSIRGVVVVKNKNASAPKMWKIFPLSSDILAVVSHLATVCPQWPAAELAGGKPPHLRLCAGFAKVPE
jgi:hypothetical protein